MHVSNLMTRHPLSCTPIDTLNRAAQLMWEHDVGCLPVVDNERKVVGMLTDRDVCMASYTQGRPLCELHVRSCMSRQVVSVRADDSIQTAASKMREHRVRRVPVVDDQHVLHGLLSLSDLARRMWPDKGAAGFDDDELLAVVASVSQPRTSAQAPKGELTPPAEPEASNGKRRAGTLKPAAAKAKR